MSPSLHRFFLPSPLETGQTVELPEHLRHQLLRVLRVQPGDEIVLFDGRGTDFRATVEVARPTQVIVRLTDAQPSRPLPPPPITLFVALLRHDHFDLVVEKATELGVVGLVPLRTQRTVVRLDERAVQNRLARWQRIALEASEQCGRGVLPEITPPCSLAEALERARTLRSVLFWEAQGISNIAGETFAPDTPLALFVGPEGGWTDDEIELFQRYDVRPLSLGPLTLRAETAAIAGIAAVRARTVLERATVTAPTATAAPPACATG